MGWNWREDQRAREEAMGWHGPKPSETRSASIDLQSDLWSGGALTLGELDLRPAELVSATLERAKALIADNAAALNLEVRRDGEAIEDHSVAHIWNRTPNPLMSPEVFRTIMFRRLLKHGQSFAVADRGATGDGDPTALWPVTDHVTVVLDDVDLLRPVVIGFLVGVRRIPVPEGELLWLRLPNGDTLFDSLAPESVASYPAKLDGYARAWQLGEFRNGGRPSGILKLGAVPKRDAERIRADLRDTVQGARNAGKVITLSADAAEGADFKPISRSPGEMGYVKSRETNAVEILMALGVPRDLVMGNSTFDNQRAAKVALWSERIVPMLSGVAGEVDRQLIPDPAETCAFDLSSVEALKESLNDVYQRVRTVVYGDVITINEARAMLGLDPIEGGDVTLTPYRAPFRMQPGGGTGDSGTAAKVMPVPRIEPPKARAKTVSLNQGEINRSMDRHEARVVRAVGRLADKMERVILKRLDRSQKRADDDLPTVDDLFDLTFWTTETSDTLEPRMVQIYEDGAEGMAGALDVDAEPFLDRVHRLMAERLQILSGQVTDTTRQAIEDAILKTGVEEGEGIPELRKRLQAVFENLSKSRADTIAITEVHGGFSAAAHEVAVESGLVSSSIWRIAGDDRVRDSHVEVDGEEVALGNTFSNGLRFPGDPLGAAKETIRCRCYAEQVLIPEEEAA